MTRQIVGKGILNEFPAHSTASTMAHTIAPLDQPSNYKDSQARLDRGRQAELLSKSTTLYVCPHFSNQTGTNSEQIGNLSFYTTEEQIYELFSKCANSEDGGGIKRVIMGLDRNSRCVRPFVASNLWI